MIKQFNNVMEVVNNQPLAMLTTKYDSEFSTLLSEMNVQPSLEYINVLMLGYVIGRREMRHNG